MNGYRRVAHGDEAYEAACKARKQGTLYVDWGDWIENSALAHKQGWNCWPSYQWINSLISFLDGAAIILIGVLWLIGFEFGVIVLVIYLVCSCLIGSEFYNHCNKVFKENYIDVSLVSKKNFDISVSTQAGADFYVPIGT